MIYINKLDMGLINNEKLYPKDDKITINDEVIGSDKDNNGTTRNYPMSSIVSLMNEVNELKFSLYKFSDDDANIRKGVFNVTGSNFKFSDTDQENNNNTVLFNVIKNSKENIIMYLKNGTENFGYYNVKNATKNTQSFTFELELIHNIKAGSYVLEDIYVFNIGITTSTLAQIQSDWNESNSVEPSFIKNKPTIPAAQVQSDWNESNANSKSFIKNKPGSIGGTDLSYVPATRTIESSTGTDAIIPLANTTNAGLMKANFYEEGTFTPDLIDTNGGATYTFTISGATFVRLGNFVRANVFLTNINTIGTPSLPNSFFYIDNMPFTSKTGSTGYNGGELIQFVGSTLTENEIQNLTPYMPSGFNRVRFSRKTEFLPKSQITFTSGVLAVSITYSTDVYTP